MVSILFQRI